MVCMNIVFSSHFHPLLLCQHSYHSIFEMLSFPPKNYHKLQMPSPNFFCFVVFWLIYLITYQIRPKWNFIDILNSNMHDTQFFKLIFLLLNTQFFPIPTHLFLSARWRFCWHIKLTRNGFCILCG